MKKGNLIKLKVFFSVMVISIALISCTNQKVGNSGTKVSAEAAKLAPLFQTGNFQDDKGNSMPYRYFEPTLNEGVKYPVIIYLHGEEENGTDNETQLTRTECATIWVEPALLAKNPTYVIAPQIPEGNVWTAEPAYGNTLALLAQFIENHPQIDKNRIYIVGFSDGATGVWNMILKNPKLFAAAMPISGNADAYLADYESWAALKNFPVIVSHAYDDQVSPVSGSLNAVAALQAGGNTFTSGSTKVALWNAGSTPVPHDAWWTAFHKFDVIIYNLFEQNLERTNYGEINPTTLYTKRDFGNGITQVWDHGLNTAWVIEGSDKAILVDATLGRGNLHQFIRDNVLKNKDIDIESFITHNDNDHIFGLTHFLGASQLKKIYVHKYDADVVAKLLGEDAAKIQLVEDGYMIPLGEKNGVAIYVPGHSRGHLILKYENYLFPGDAIGTGYIGCGDLFVEDYIKSVQHLIDVMGNEKYTILAGHTGECRYPMTEKYVYELLDCAKGIVDGSILGTPYWRNLRYVATNGDANITYDINNIHRIEGALFSLSISEGTLSPVFAKYLSYYSAAVDENVRTIEIIADVYSENYKGLTINENTMISGSPYKADLAKGSNRFSIAVTASDDITRVYTLSVTRGK